MASSQSFRVVVLSSLAPYALMRLIARIHEDVPEARVCGILYGRRVRVKAFRQRVVEFLRNLRDPSFIAYAAGRIARSLLSPFARLGAAGLRFVHASPRRTAPSMAFGLQDLSDFCAACDCSLFVTPDMHAPASLEYVRGLRPDLGLVYGTRILKPELFEIHA